MAGTIQVATNSLNSISFNEIFERTEIVSRIKKLLKEFNEKKHDLSIKRGIYIYGSPGSGKSEFVSHILKELSYDAVHYDAGDIRNKGVIETITKHNMSDQSVMSIFGKTPKKIAVVMDEVDGMNTGDKGGITSLIKLIRPKKTKKQKTEDYTMNPIICIGNYDMDKKIKEIMKVCHVIELPTPTFCQMKSLIGETMKNIPFSLTEKIARFTQYDLRKFMLIYEIYLKDPSIISEETLDTIFKPKMCSENSKVIVNQLFKSNYSIGQHTSIISETDRTIVGLLWHENVVDKIFTSRNMYSQEGGFFYEKILKNICFADYIDRITFQKQIWIFNEMSSLVKTFYNNNLYNEYKLTRNLPGATVSSTDTIRFTKVLTKYSTEYNNILFIQHMCNELMMDKKDIIEFFNKIKHNNDENLATACCEQHDITRLDVDRMFRYIDKCFNGQPVQFAVKGSCDFHYHGVHGNDNDDGGYNGDVDVECYNMHNYLNLDDIDDSELIIDSGDNGHNGHNGYNEETQVIPVPGSGSAVSRRKKEKDKNKVTSKAGCNTVSKSKKNEKKMEHETTP
jgi:hypothetical protein